MIRKTFLAAAAGLAAAGAPAIASDRENIEMCFAAIAEDDPTATNFDVESISGASLRKIVISVETDAGPREALCAVKRGSVREIEWR